MEDFTRVAQNGGAKKFIYMNLTLTSLFQVIANICERKNSKDHNEVSSDISILSLIIEIRRIRIVLKEELHDERFIFSVPPCLKEKKREEERLPSPASPIVTPAPPLDTARFSSLLSFSLLSSPGHVVLLPLSLSRYLRLSR